MIRKEDGTTSKEELIKAAGLTAKEAKDLKRITSLTDGQLFQFKPFLIDPTIKSINTESEHDLSQINILNELEKVWQVYFIDIDLYLVVEDIELDRQERAWDLPQCTLKNSKIRNRCIKKGQLIYVRADHRRKTVEIEGVYSNSDPKKRAKTHQVYRVGYDRFFALYQKKLTKK